MEALVPYGILDVNVGVVTEDNGYLIFRWYGHSTIWQLFKNILQELNLSFVGGSIGLYVIA